MAPTGVADVGNEESIRRDLIRGITSSWEDVVKTYKEHPISRTMKIGKSCNTALHIAVECGREETVEQLVKQITETSEEPADVLSKKNKRGNTPLHLAASLGSVRMCKCITGDNKYQLLLKNRNKKSETPLFLAARHGRKDAFLWLYKKCDTAAEAHECCQIHGGGTVLHCAIEGGYFDLAFQIIHMVEDPNLMDYFDEKKSPLHLLAQKPTAFKSGIHLGLFKKVIYHCIYVEELIPETSEEKKKLESHQHPKNYQTCINIFPKPWQMIKLPGKNNKHLDAENPTEEQGINEDHDQQSPSNFCQCLRSIKLIISKALLIILLRIPGSSEIKKLKGRKEMHIWSLQIMNKLLEHAKSYEDQAKNERNKQLLQHHEHEAARKGNRFCHSEYEYFRRGHVPSTPILIAARNGIEEMVEKILQDFPMTIHDMDEKGKNIVLLAVENRQSHIYDSLHKSSHLLDRDLAFRAIDEDENNALHLAAKLKKYESWLIPSSILQMHWEVKWYEYVKKSLPRYVFASSGGHVKAPEEIFTEEHKELLHKSKEWLNSICNSCSFIAALIATVAFASSATVPGGVNDTGEPIFKHCLAFRVFAISALVALCSSFVSLLIFLAILISKYEYKDFSKNLPINLFFGLSFLFISMVAMLSCFISGHFLMLDNDDRLKYYAAVPVYAVTFLVITFFSLPQLPSYFALGRAAFQKVPERIYKEDPL